MEYLGTIIASAIIVMSWVIIVALGIRYLFLRKKKSRLMKERDRLIGEQSDGSK